MASMLIVRQAQTCGVILGGWLGIDEQILLFQHHHHLNEIVRQCATTIAA